MKRPAPLVLDYAEDLGGKRFCFFGSFEAWPRVLGSAGPKAHVERRGGRLAKTVDRGIRMLKKQALQLYSQATADAVGGIVKSQTLEDGFYACWIREDGQYSCFAAALALCMGLSGDLCKHLVVLLLGLAVQGVLDPRRAYAWALSASKKWPVEDQARSAELVLRYRGAQAGEIDWRPTETVPEDYYAL